MSYSVRVDAPDRPDVYFVAEPAWGLSGMTRITEYRRETPVDHVISTVTFPTALIEELVGSWLQRDAIRKIEDTDHRDAFRALFHDPSDL